MDPHNQSVVCRTLHVTHPNHRLTELQMLFLKFFVKTYETWKNTDLLDKEFWKKTSYFLSEIVQDLQSDSSRLFYLLDTQTLVSVQYSDGSEGISNQFLNELMKLLLDWCKENVDYGENLSQFEVYTRTKIEEYRQKIVDLVPPNLLF